MTEGADNPYASPRAPFREPGLWRRIWYFFTAHSTDDPFLVTYEQFLAGDIQMLEGIAFFLDPTNEEFVYATSASNDRSGPRMKLIVSEAVRMLPELIDTYPEFSSYSTGRKLVIGIIEDYSDPRQDFRFEQQTTTPLSSLRK